MTIRLPGSDFPRPIRILFGLTVLYGLATCERVHVQVVDQHGDPVRGALVRSNIQPGNAYLFNSETTIERTDWGGGVTLPGGSWFTINEVRKDGYQFRVTEQFSREHGSTDLGKWASRFDRTNPLVVKGWKRGEVPDLTYVGGRVYFPDNLEQCTLTLVEPNKGNGLEKPLQVRFDIESKFRKHEDTGNPNHLYRANKWKAWFELTDAKLLATDDLFMNYAPKDGYDKKLTMGPLQFGRGNQRLDPVEPQMYAKGKDEDFYGGAVLFMKPDRGTKPSLDVVNRQGMAFQFWFNFDGDRNVMREDRRIVWKVFQGSLDESYSCEEEVRR